MLVCFLTIHIATNAIYHKCLANKQMLPRSKQTNATPVALSGLLTGVDSVRLATLQNRAAVDFLLLAQGCGCEDFEGMCYMNLPDHSESIFKSI